MRWRAAAALACALASCQGRETPPTGTARGSAPAATPRDAAIAAAPADATALDPWARCGRALREAAKLPANRRVAALLAGCQPCGDWTPLLAWDRPEADGGPSRAAIDGAMARCEAYCSPDAKQRFLGTLDNARAKGTRTPWRSLGRLCGDKVSARADPRFVSPTYFALDRIARAVAAKPALAPLLAAIDVPLPAISISGAGLELPRAPVTAPTVGPLALTVTARELRLAALPHARLGADGVRVIAADPPYPGALVTTPASLDAALAPLGDGAITVFAPTGLRARRVVDALALAGRARTRRELRLAVAAHGGPPGWPIDGSIPLALTATPARDAIPLALPADDPDPAIKAAQARRAALAHHPIVIAIGPTTTVAALAKLLGALVYFDPAQVALTQA